MSDPLFFGYGSLVNVSTHDYAHPRQARLTSWRRVWRHTDRRTAAYLSVEPAEGVAIDGIVAAVPGADWTALDAREAAYLRRDVTHLVSQSGTAGSVAVYEVSPDRLVPQADHPILLSYLDVVVQGYLREFGEAGVEDFFATTAGWSTPIHDDRAAPVYSRHQVIRAAERALVDRHLCRVA